MLFYTDSYSQNKYITKLENYQVDCQFTIEDFKLFKSLQYKDGLNDDDSVINWGYKYQIIYCGISFQNEKTEQCLIKYKINVEDQEDVLYNIISLYIDYERIERKITLIQRKVFTERL